MSEQRCEGCDCVVDPKDTHAVKVDGKPYHVSCVGKYALVAEVKRLQKRLDRRAASSASGEREQP